jgi:hypothetical protein
MARANHNWGYTRIQGALQNLGHEIGRATIAKVLKEAGVEPAPDRQRKTTWKEFLRSHWEVLASADFFCVEVWTALGLVRYHVFFVIRLVTREVHLASIVPEASLHRATTQFVVHYRQERNHQGLDNKLIRPEFSPLPTEGSIRRRKRLGGWLNYYYREAA